MKLTLILMSFLSLLFGDKLQQSDAITILDRDAFKSAIATPGVQLIDVRTANEYSSGHIAKAQNIDYFKTSEFTTKVNKLDKDTPVYLYCRSGNRSQRAAAKLDSLGFKIIFDLEDGYNNWK